MTNEELQCDIRDVCKDTGLNEKEWGAYLKDYRLFCTELTVRELQQEVVASMRSEKTEHKGTWRLGITELARRIDKAEGEGVAFSDPSSFFDYVAKLEELEAETV